MMAVGGGLGDMQNAAIWLFFSAKGRINRKPFWLVLIGVTCLGFGVTFLEAFVLARGGLTASQAFLTALVQPVTVGEIILWLITWPISIFVYIKRAHDRDRNGWFILLLLVPFLQLWPLVELCFLEGTRGSNRFGADSRMPQMA